MTDKALLQAFGLEELIASNGQIATCFSCGAPVDAKRHTPGNRSWCSTCRAEGKPNVQRVRDWRERRGKIR
jgi:hypothetical protein